MPFAVDVSKRARSDLAKLDPHVARRIASKIRDTAAEPARHYRRLKAAPAYSLRIGEWRAIAQIDWDEESIVILTVGHRRNIYD